MRVIESLTELVIIARELGGDDSPEVRRVLRVAERQIDSLRYQRDKRARRGLDNTCLRCEQRRTKDLLCLACWADAPRPVQEAFRASTGLDGMRAATALVTSWARRDFQEEAQVA